MFRQSPNHSIRSISQSTKCVFEPIEARQLMSASLNMGVLNITATDGNDIVVVEQLSKDRLRVTENGKVSTFKASKVSRISASLGKGEDSYDGRSVNKSQYVSGGEGRDVILGGRKNDELLGQDGDDTLFGREGDDSLSGEGGYDQLAGGSGNDTLSGGTENDYLWGEAGSDLLIGGEGSDDARYDDEVIDDRAARRGGVLVGLAAPGAGNISSNNGQDRENDRIAGDVENLVGTRFADTLIGNDVSNYIAGLDGDDLISGRAGDDTLDPGKGADAVYGEAGNDLLLGKDGAYTDYLDGGADRDTIEIDSAGTSIPIDAKRTIDAYFNGELIR